MFEICSLFPDADIFTVLDFATNETRTKLHGRHAHTTFIQRLPQAKKRYRTYLPLMPLAIEQLDLSGYDLIISSSHAVAKGVLVGPDQLHICYCHSPIRYAWDMQHQYLRESGLDHGLKGMLARYLLHRIRNWDARTAHGVDYFVSNSNYIGRRIQKVYHRSSTTIYPNVAIHDFECVAEKSDFYLTASRMVPYKKVALIVRSFAAMPDKRLVVIGDGPEMDQVRKVATPNVTVMGYQPFDVLKDYMQRAKAFVYAAEEDFGIVVVEAQACGTPVIAYGRGGALETVIPDKTGVFFDEQSEAAIQEAVQGFEASFKTDSPLIRRHAEQFSAERFRSQFKAFVDDKVEQFFSYKK